MHSADMIKSWRRRWNSVPSESVFCHEDPAKLVALFSVFFEVRCKDRPQNALVRASDECEVFHTILQCGMSTSEGAKSQVDHS